MRSAPPASVVRVSRIFRSVFLTALVVFLSASYFLPATVAHAANFSVTPAVIDGKGKLREIMKYTVTVENTAKHLVSIYPWVTDLDTEVGQVGSSDLGGGAPSDDRAAKLSRWIEVTRGVVDLMPGEKKELPIMIQIPPGAKPGIYHALIHLSEGPNRVTAESNELGTDDVTVNIEVLEDINERMQMLVFSPIKNYFTGSDASFKFAIQNIGNRGLTPGGKIHIYDQKGKEVAEVVANADGKRLEPSEKAELAAVWAAGNEFGRYKAKIELEYGARGVLEDTAYFWVLPWQKLLGMFFALIVVCVVVALLLHSRTMASRGAYHYAPEYVEELREAVEEERAHHAYQGNDGNRDTDTGEQDGRRSWMTVATDTIKRPFARWGNEYDVTNDGLVEVDIPPPQRTSGRARVERNVRSQYHHEHAVHLSHISEPEVVHESHKVHIPARPKPRVDPRHIVKLSK